MMLCPLCSVFNGTNPFFMGLHLRQTHDLHSSYQVLARAMFLNSVGYNEAMMVLKDFEMRDQKYRNSEKYHHHQSEKYDKSAQAESSKTDKEVKVGKISENNTSRSNRIKFEEYWEDGYCGPTTNKVFTLSQEENEVFEELKKFLDSQNKEIASLKSKLILSKDNDDSDEIERLKNLLKDQTNTTEDLKKIVKTQKDRLEEIECDIFSSKSSQEDKEQEILGIRNSRRFTLSKELASCKKLLVGTEKEKESKNAEQKTKDVQHSKIMDFGKSNKEKNKIYKQHQLFQSARKSVNNLLDDNMNTTDKITEALTNTKAACKYMISNVTKQFEDFEAEIEAMNVRISADNDRDALAAAATNLYDTKVRNQTKNMDCRIVHYDNAERKIKVVDYDSEDDSAEEENSINDKVSVSEMIPVVIKRKIDAVEIKKMKNY